MLEPTLISLLENAIVIPEDTALLITIELHFIYKLRKMSEILSERETKREPKKLTGKFGTR